MTEEPSLPTFKKKSEEEPVLHNYLLLAKLKSMWRKLEVTL